MRFTSEGMAADVGESAVIFNKSENEEKMNTDLRELFRQLSGEKLIQINLSNSKNADRAAKAKIRPVLMRGELSFQETIYRGTQVFHTNYAFDELMAKIVDDMETLYRQAQIICTDEEITILVSKKGTVTVKRRKKQAELNKPLSHNREKKYIIKEGEPVDFLVELGVLSETGRVTKASYDKFRQINRYLEFIEDVLDKLPADRTMRIIDFGCGKSYLTFAMYYYLHQLKKRDIRVTGLDLKKDVIQHCNELAKRLGYEKLDFCVGDIKDYSGEDHVDMVVSLHACDKATDYALEKAVKWGAEVILAVPCCQHEVNKQIKCDVLQPVLKYGIIKERMSALITDALRADILEQHGYETQILEFIDMEHTPKNLLIRAVKKGGMRPRRDAASVDQLTDFLQIHPTLKDLL